MQSAGDENVKNSSSLHIEMDILNLFVVRKPFQTSNDKLCIY